MHALICFTEKELSYFYPTISSVLPGNDVKTLKYVTPNHCARLCVDEEGFVCRSFDYEVRVTQAMISNRLLLASFVGHRRCVSSER